MRKLFSLVLLMAAVRPAVADSFEHGFDVGTWRAAVNACGLVPGALHVQDLMKAIERADFKRGYEAGPEAGTKLARGMKDSDANGFLALCADMRRGARPKGKQL